MNIDSQSILAAVNSHSFSTFIVVFWAAAVLSLVSCTIIRIPIVVGLIGGASDSKKKAFLLTLSFVAALVLSYTMLGVILGYIESFAAKMIGISRYIYYFAGIVILAVGLRMAGILKARFIEVFEARAFDIRQKGIAGAFILGFMFVLFEAPTCPVCGPFLIIIVGLGVVKSNFWYAVALFFTYALGQSLPILLVGVFSGIVKYLHPKVEAVERVAPVIGGNILIAVGILLLILG
jgi:cytochrome c-type biogenesis protein